MIETCSKVWEPLASKAVSKCSTNVCSVQDQLPNVWDPIFENCSESQDGDRRALDQAQGPPRQEPAVTFSLPLISSGAIPPLNYEGKETTQWAKGTRSEEVQGSCGGAFASWVCGMFV